MLDTLSRIVQKVSASPDLETALSLIVSQVSETLDVDVCSVYLLEEHDDFPTRFILRATHGLAPESVGQISLAAGEGLVGLVAERAEPVNLDNAPEHPRYRYFESLGEEPFPAFLGVPITHRSQLQGVLVVQDRAQRRFSDEQVSFLVTLAAQLASAISHAKAAGEAVHPPRSTYGLRFVGLPGAPGVSEGTAVVIYPKARLAAVPDLRCLDAAGEEARLLAAIQAVREEMQRQSEAMANLLPNEERAVFDAYAMMLDSDSLIDGMREQIAEGLWAPAALRNTIEAHAQVFDSMGDGYLRERADDVRDLGQLVLQKLQDDGDTVQDYPRRTILVGEDINASHLGDVPPERLAGIVSARGSGSSHVAILARALGIPAVMGATDLPVEKLQRREIIVDGYRGQAFVEPVGQLRAELLRLAREERELAEGLAELVDLPAETPDGVRIHLYVNAGLLADMAPSLSSGAEGIGLYRTEVPFQVHPRFPGEEEQARIYREALQSFAPRPVVLRTLDVGGDKPLPYFPVSEENPFLGWRGIRMTLDHPEILLTQFRAMLRANVGLDNLQVLLPMISGIGELEEAQNLLRQAVFELHEEELPVAMPPLGAMVEVPAAVYQAEELAARADFLSIGTNDLTQYLLAVDRNNERVAKLYDALHPAVLRAIQDVVDAAERHDKPVSVCGELAGDPMGALLLMGMGIHSLSMSAGSLVRVKWVIRTIGYAKARALVREALELQDAQCVRMLLFDALESHGLGGLVRAGK